MGESGIVSGSSISSGIGTLGGGGGCGGVEGEGEQESAAGINMSSSLRRGCSGCFGKVGAGAVLGTMAGASTE